MWNNWQDYRLYLTCNKTGTYSLLLHSTPRGQKTPKWKWVNCNKSTETNPNPTSQCKFNDKSRITERHWRKAGGKQGCLNHSLTALCVCLSPSAESCQDLMPWSIRVVNPREAQPSFSAELGLFTLWTNFIISRCIRSDLSAELPLALKKLHPDLFVFLEKLSDSERLSFLFCGFFFFFLLHFKALLAFSFIIRHFTAFIPVWGCCCHSFDISSIVLLLLPLHTKPLLYPSALTVTLAGVSRDLSGLASWPLVCLWFLLSSVRFSFPPRSSSISFLVFCPHLPSPPLHSFHFSSFLLYCALHIPSCPLFTPSWNFPRLSFY